MWPARIQPRVVISTSSRWIAHRSQHDSARDPTATQTATQSSQPEERTLSGSAKLFADAEIEERLDSTNSKSRDHLVLTQGNVWTGDETTHDAVLRMLVDAHKPLRTGEGIKPNSSEEKIRRWMKALDTEPRLRVSQPVVETMDNPEIKVETPKINPHRTTIPPHLHRPWHATYTGDANHAHHLTTTPQVKYGQFIQKRIDGDALASELELRIPGSDGKVRSALRDARRSGKVRRRLEGAREGAIDYKLGIGERELVDASVTDSWEEGEAGGQKGERFTGNRQIKGSSVLGAGRGGASGMRAWAGLVEDRIQRAREAGFFKTTSGRGAPIPLDPEAGNPHLELGERLMNRIVKRQGALPAWIELQNNLDSTLNAFRSTLRSTYVNHLVRTVLSTNSLHPLPPYHTIPTHDEAWEAREKKFHEENVKQINDLVRKMNAQAPSVARRHLITREIELDKVRGVGLRDEVWEEVKRRAEEWKELDRTGMRKVGGGSGQQMMGVSFEGEDGLAKLGRITRRSLWTIAHPIASVLGKGPDAPSSAGVSRNGNSANDSFSAPQSSTDPWAVVLVAGVGIGAILYFRRPTRNDSQPPPKPASSSSSSPPVTHIVPDLPLDTPLTPLLLIQTYIIEPFLTFLRFIHLALLFGPVILSSPMLLVGATPINRRRPGKPVPDDDDNWGAIWWYGFLVKQMERAGPSFTKLGQWAASRADLFPAALCSKMSKLHSNGKPHSLKYTKEIISRAFALEFDEIFEEFGEEPIGCGAIAQVYKAKLRPEIVTGSKPDSEDAQKLAEEAANPHGDDRISTSVAIKVIHPWARKTIRRDIAIMSVFANILNSLPGMQWISLPEEVAVFGQMMNSQLDLRVEASNLDRFLFNFRRRGRNVTFPKPIGLDREDEKEEVTVKGNAEEGERNKRGRELAKSQILVEEFEDALPLKYFLENGGGPYDDTIANIGLDAFLEMLLLDNWTHGDLHPGNIMVRFIKPSTGDFFKPLLSQLRLTSSSSQHSSPTATIPHESASATELVHSLSKIAHDKEAWLDRLDTLSSEGYVPQLIFIDAGLVTSLDDTNRRNFLDLFQAVAEFDGYKAGKLMVERCRTPEFCIDEETFALKMQHLVLSVKSKTFSLAKIKISDILSDVLTAVRQHHVKMEGDFVNTVISILLLEGIGRQLDPNMDLFKSALPIMRQLGRQMGTREAISAVPVGNIWAMAKLWIWAEAREVVGEATAIDDWIKYDQFTPGI